MKKRFLLLGCAVAALAIAGAAQAKGPSEAKVTGPGLKKTIVLKGAEDNMNAPLTQFADAAGFFPEAYGQIPDSTTRDRPSGALGPKYRVVYRVPGPYGHAGTVRQDVYPYAKDGPVTYMKPGTKVFSGMKTHGGWYSATEDVRAILNARGLPAKAPKIASHSTLSSWAPPSLIGVLALVGVAFAVVLRRRRPDTP
jgi:MYXO-CTERM domain-containing protein